MRLAERVLRVFVCSFSLSVCVFDSFAFAFFVRLFVQMADPEVLWNTSDAGKNLHAQRRTLVEQVCVCMCRFACLPTNVACVPVRECVRA